MKAGDGVQRPERTRGLGNSVGEYVSGWGGRRRCKEGVLLFDSSHSGEQKFMPSCKRAELYPGEFLLRAAVISKTMTFASWLGQTRRLDWTRRICFALKEVPHKASGGFT